MYVQGKVNLAKGTVVGSLNQMPGANQKVAVRFRCYLAVFYDIADSYRPTFIDSSPARRNILPSSEMKDQALHRHKVPSSSMLLLKTM